MGGVITILLLLLSLLVTGCNSDDDDSSEEFQPKVINIPDGTYTIGNVSFTISGSTVKDSYGKSIGTVADGKVTINLTDETWVITAYDGGDIVLVKTESGSTTSTTYKGSLSTGKLVNVDNTGDELTIAEKSSTDEKSDDSQDTPDTPNKDDDTSNKGGDTSTASIATAPAATAGDIEAGSTTTLVSAGAASGGTMMYAVTTENTKPSSTEDFSATIPTAENLTAGTYYVWYYVKGDDSHEDSAISSEAITVTIVAAAPSAYTITVTGGKATSTLEPGVPGITSAEPGDTVYVKFTEADVKFFDKWEASEGVTLADPTSAVTSFTMIASNVTITAKSKPKYTVTVVNGSVAYDTTGNSEATAGETVYISANSPDSGKEFDKWVSNNGVTFDNASSSSTYFTMIAENVTVTATYKDSILKPHPDALYDLVLNDGTACSWDQVMYLKNPQRRAACGVVYKLEEGKAWVVELKEGTTKYAWAKDGSEPASTAVGTSEYDGASNTAKFAQSPDDFPLYAHIAELASKTITGELTGWYLPALEELRYLMPYSSGINGVLQDIIEANPSLATRINTNGSEGYWSSTESGGEAAYCYKFDIEILSKTYATQNKCRAIKVISTVFDESGDLGD